MSVRGGCVAVLVMGRLVLPGPAGAMPRGYLNTWVESRTLQYGAFGRDLNFNTQLFHSDGLWLPDNAGVWTTYLEYTAYDAEFLLDAREIPTGWGRLALSAGDFPWQLVEDDLRREYRQNTSVRGASVRLDRGLEWQASGGTLTERGLFLGTGRTSSHVPVMRLGVGSAWRKTGRWDLTWENQWQSGDQSGRQLTTLYLSRPLTGDWRSSAEGRVSRTQSGNWGSSWAADLSRQTPKAVVGMGARRVSRSFAGIGLHRDPHVNEWGGRLHAAMRLSRNSLAGFFVDAARDLGTDVSGRDAERRLQGRVHLSTGLGGPFYAQTRVSYRNRSTIDPDSLLVDQNAVSGRVETGVRGRVLQGYVSYSRGLFRSRVDNEPDWHEDRLESQWNLNLGPWFRAQVSGQTAERRLPDGTWTSRETRAEIRLMAEPSEKRRGWILAGREVQDAAVDDFQRNNLVVGAGWWQSLPGDLGFELEAQAAYALDTRRLDSTRWSGRLTHHWDFGGNPVRVHEPVDEYGTVSGFVFEDTNENGVRDPLEPGIPGQALRLGSGPSAITREDGSFYFERADIILDYLRFKAAHLASRYLPPETREFELHLNPGDHRRIDIPVRRAATVSGRVVAVDETGAVHGVAGALIRVDGSHRDAFTDEEGRYLIGGLPGGEQTLELVEWSIPAHHEPVGNRRKTVVLTSGERTQASDFQLRDTDPVLLQWFRLR